MTRKKKRVRKSTPPPPAHRPAHNRRAWLYAALVVLVTLTVWHGTLSVPFHFDDVHTVLDNPDIHDLGNSKRFMANFFSRGLLYVGYTLNYAIAQKSPDGTPGARSFHAVNLLMHVVNGFLAYCLVLAILRRLGRGADNSSAEIAAGVALLFALHPVQTMAVNLIASRAVVQAATFSLVSLIFWVKALDPGRSRRERIAWVAASVAAMLCSLASKAVGVATIGLAALLSGFILRRELTRPRNLAILLLASGLIGSLAVAVLVATGDVWQASFHSVWVNLLTQARVVTRYLQLLAFPVGLNVDHDQPLASSLFQPNTALAFLVICVLLAAGIFLAYRRSFLGLSLTWFLVTLAPSSSVVPRLETMLEYRVYLAALGFAGAGVWALNRLGTRLAQVLPAQVKPRWTTGGLFVLVLAALSLGTIQRNRVFADPVRLWADASAKSPQKFRPRFNLGISVGEQGKLAEAIGHYRDAIRLNPDEVDIHVNLGNALARQKRLPEAISQYSEALRLKPDFPQAHNNLGLMLAQQGKIDEAISHYFEALRIKPDHVTALSNLGNALAMQGKLDKAISYFSEALRLEPQFAEAHYYLGRVLAMQGKLEDAISHFSEALRLRPAYRPAQRSLRQALKKKGRL